MALATLTVDLNARLASFERDLGRSVQIAQANASLLEKSVAGVSNVIRGLGAGIGIAVLAGIAKNAITSAGALQDLSEATGASVENLSKLQQIAVIAGQDFSGVETAITRLNKNLHGTDDESKGAGAALAALSLKAADLRNLDPGDSLRTIAERLNKFADSGSKAALVEALLGKGAAQLSPYLKDLAEAGQIQARTTDEQAEAADLLQKNLSRLGLEFSDVGRSITNSFLGPISQAAEEIRLASRAADGFGAGLLNSMGLNLQDAERELSKTEDRLRSLGKTRDELAGESGPIAFLQLQSNKAETARLEKRQEFLRNYLAEEDKLVKSNADKPQIDFRSDRGKGGKAEKPVDYFGAVWQASIEDLRQFKTEYDGVIASLLSGTDQGRIDALAKDLEKISSALKAGEIDDDQFRAVTAQIEKQYHALIPANAELERLNELLSNTPSAALEKTRQDMLLLAAAFESGRLNAERYFEAVNVSLGTVDSAPAVKELTAVGIAIQGIAADAASAFTDLLFEGKNTFADLAKFALKELAKIVLFQSVFGPLASRISGGLAGTGFAAGLASLGKRASGGPVIGGMSYLVGEKGTEIFKPSSSGSIIPNLAIQSAGGSNNYVTVNVSTQGSPAVNGNSQSASQLGRLIGGAVRQVLIEERRPGGVLA